MRLGFVAATAAAGIAASVTFVPRASFASGFLIYDLSGEAIGRASAVSAESAEPAAVWFNPAQLPYQEGASGSAGGVLVTARSTFTPAAPNTAQTDSKRGVFFLPTVFAGAKVSDRVALGMGVYTAFGIGIRWPDDWVGREAAISASLQTLAFNPTVAIKLHPQLSIAAGFDAIRATVDFQNGLPSIVGGDVRLVGGTWGFGGNVAILYRIIPERLHAALTYRSRAKLDFDGNANFSPANPDFDRMLPDQPGTASITLPDIFTAGVMGRVMPNLTLEVDANLTLWQTYDEIDIRFSNPTTPSRTLRPDGHAALTLRAGADWAVARAPGLHLRAGVIWDGSALPAEGVGPGLPDSNRIDGTLGVGYARGVFKADLGYMLVTFLGADAKSGRESPVGTYKTTAHLIGLTLAARWGGGGANP